MDLTVFQKQYKKDDVSFRITISIAGNPIKGNLQWYVTVGGDGGLSSGEGMILGPKLLLDALEPYKLDLKTTSDLLYFYGQMVATCDNQDWMGNFDLLQLAGIVDPPFNDEGVYIAQDSPQSIDEL